MRVEFRHDGSLIGIWRSVNGWAFAEGRGYRIDLRDKDGVSRGLWQVNRIYQGASVAVIHVQPAGEA